MDNYQFLLYLRIGLVAILYLVILQIVLVSRRDLRQAEKPATASTTTRDSSDCWTPDFDR